MPPSTALPPARMAPMHLKSARGKWSKKGTLSVQKRQMRSRQWARQSQSATGGSGRRLSHWSLQILQQRKAWRCVPVGQVCVFLMAGALFAHFSCHCLDRAALNTFAACPVPILSRLRRLCRCEMQPACWTSQVQSTLYHL